MATPLPSLANRSDGARRGGLMCVVGARPNFMKAAPLLDAFAEGPTPLPCTLVHTGQHYDEAMKESFFRQLGIPEPDVDLEVGSGSHAWQTAEIMRRFEPVLEALRPELLIVVGDVNSTLACALVAAKAGVPVAHVEAGLRSFDRTMPEEVNRVLTDQLSELLFTTEPGARENLLREGIAPWRIHFVGNVMIDTLRAHLHRAVPALETLAWLMPRRIREVGEHGYALLTLHRPANVDHPAVLEGILTVVADLARRLPVVFPVHPRTRDAVERLGIRDRLERAGVVLCEPLGYLEMLGLMREARLVLTDSGGVQEETTALGVPCLTLRENTERPVTLSQGTNVLVGTDAHRIRREAERILRGERRAAGQPPKWDGSAARRIRKVIERWLHDRGARLSAAGA